MTGLNLETDVIIEIFCIITDGNLKVLDPEGWGVVVHQSKETMDKMVPLQLPNISIKLTFRKGEWCTKTHRDTGLTAAVLASTTSAEDAATGLLEYIKRFVPERKVALLAGNSVHADKAFLRKAPYYPVHSHLSHRILDVSTLKEAAARWCSHEVMRNVPKKKVLHKAKDDILESIEEARYYKEAIFSGR